MYDMADNLSATGT